MKTNEITFKQEWWDTLNSLTSNQTILRNACYSIMRYAFLGIKYDGDEPIIKVVMQKVEADIGYKVRGRINKLSSIGKIKTPQPITEEVFDEALDEASLPTEVLEEFDEAQERATIVEMGVTDEPPEEEVDETLESEMPNEVIVEEVQPQQEIPVAVREGCVTMEEYEFVKRNEESGTDMTHLPKTKFLRHARLVEKVREYYNEMVDTNGSKLPKCEYLSRAETDNLKGLLMIYGKDIIKEVIMKFTRSKEVNEMVNTSWCSGLVWLSSSKHFIGLLNGNYGVEPTELNFNN